jgi:hypothetical protein
LLITIWLDQLWIGITIGSLLSAAITLTGATATIEDSKKLFAILDINFSLIRIKIRRTEVPPQYFAKYFTNSDQDF